MLLCESKIINKNPKYRIIKYNDEYLMVDIISTWISLFFPFINWFIPKEYVKISREEFENLNIYNTKNKRSKIFLIPTLKNVCFTLFGYILFGGLTMLFLDALLSMSYQNIIVYFVWIAVIMGFFLVNIALIIDKNIHVILKNQ
ncbi:TPA: DUF443 family protein [Staphylococcus aureus]|nr:DUF443 family protein [Staphylococcus aureus]